MYRIKQNNEVIATVDELTFVKQNPRNQTIVGCTERDAMGIFVNNTTYHLPHLKPWEGVAECEVEFFDGVEQLDDAIAALATLGYPEEV